MLSIQKKNEVLESAKEELQKQAYKKDKELMKMRNALDQLEEQLRTQRMENNKESQSIRHKDQQLIDRFQQARRHAESAEKERDFISRQVTTIFAF